MEDLSEEGRIIQNNTKAYREVKKGYSAFLENDVLFAKITPCMENGKGALAKNLINGLGYGSTEFHVLRSKNGIEPYFLYYHTIGRKFRLAAEAEMTGTAGQQRVHSDFFSRFRIFTPDESVQKQLANKLIVIDKKILSEQNYLKKLIEIKTGLLKDLLTGNVRVIP